MSYFKGDGFVLSAEKYYLTVEQNAKRSAKLLCNLVSIVGDLGKIIPATGCYAGKQEQAYVVIVNPDVVQGDPRLLAELTMSIMYEAVQMRQDSILVFGSDTARLVYLEEFHGYVREIMEGLLILRPDKYLSQQLRVKTEASASEDYTEVNGQKFYFV